MLSIYFGTNYATHNSKTARHNTQNIKTIKNAIIDNRITKKVTFIPTNRINATIK